MDRNVLKDVLSAIVAEETMKDFRQLKELIAEAVDVVFDIAQEPLVAAGYEIQRSRAVSKFDLKEKTIERVARMDVIIPFGAEE